MKIDDKVRHRGTPGEPYALKGQHGVVLRVTPSYRSIPAMAYVVWPDERGDFMTWERQADLTVLTERARNDDRD